MLKKLRRYFIGKFLDQTEDLFEQARAILLIHCCWVFLLLYLLPLTTDLIKGMEKAFLKHLVDFILLLLLCAIIRRSTSLDRLINAFFGISFFSLGISFLVLNPETIDLLSIAWTFFFIFLSALLQRGAMRLLFVLVIGWLPILYIWLNIQFKGALTIPVLVQEDIGERPLLLILIPAWLGIYAFWNHTATIRIAQRKMEAQQTTIAQKNIEITDSINYALRIQTAILPSISMVQQHLAESFVLFKPKDIVAGDFFWMETVNDHVLFAACDCTGHGVPGAMVSVVCHNALNRCVREFGLTDPGKILDEASRIVR